MDKLAFLMKILISFHLFRKEAGLEYALKIIQFGEIYPWMSACIILRVQKVFKNQKYNPRYCLSKKCWILINTQKQNLQILVVEIKEN